MAKEVYENGYHHQFSGKTGTLFSRIGHCTGGAGGHRYSDYHGDEGSCQYFKHNEHLRLELAQGIALALEFKLGGEVLRTVIVREWTELLILGAVIALRGVLTLLLHWEIKVEEEHDERLLKLKAMEEAEKTAEASKQ